MLQTDRYAHHPSKPRWFVRQDVDGLLGLALDNLIQLLLIVGLCRGLLGYPSTLVYGRILPAVALSLIVGNVYYSWLAYRLGINEGRDDRTALPYGINTIALFAHVFLVMLPIKLMALDRGATMDEAMTLSWQAGLVACLGSGVIELIGSVLADPLRRWLPRAALLSTLAGIGLTFIALGFLFRTYEYPVVALVPLGIILFTYFGRVQFPIPGGLLAVLVGTALAWITGLARPDAATFSEAIAAVGWHPPGLFVEALLAIARGLAHAAQRHSADGPLQSRGESAEPGECRGGRRCVPDRALPRGQRGRVCRSGGLRLLFSNLHLYRSSGLESDGRPHRLFLA